MRLLTFRWMAAVFLLVSGAAVLSAQCDEDHHVSWPAVNPVWDFCYQRAGESSLANGEGIRVYDVLYKGVKFLRAGSVPILNVQYAIEAAPGVFVTDGLPVLCGDGVSFCYRDWFNEESPFSCAPDGGGRCDGTATAPSTVCAHPGTDAGSFRGVAVYDKGTSLKLTSQQQAGWYRYISTWEFFPDGTLRPGMEITAVDFPCVEFTHRHHAYFRLDFDLGAGNDNYVDLITGSSQRLATERSFVDNGTNRSHWRIGSDTAPAYVDVIRGAGDNAAQGDTFAVADGWLLAYHPNEIDDGFHSLGDCPNELNNYLTNETVDHADDVLWVHSLVIHQGEPGGLAADCSIIGPAITVTIFDHPPLAANDSYTLAAGETLAIAAPGVLGNDSDSDPGDTLTANVLTPPAHGSLALNADGSFTYTPAACFSGADTFQYSAADQRGLTSVATVNLTLTPGASCFYPVTPCRIFDSRAAGQGPALSSGTPRSVSLVSACGIPPTATAVSLNLTATQPGNAGSLVLFPGTPSQGAPATVYFQPGQTRANNVVIGLGPGGTLSLEPFLQSGGQVDAILDVNGYFQ